MNSRGKIYQNTLLLSSLSVLERALGFIYRVALARLLGAEGLGVYQIAVSHFFLLRTLGGGGLPVTLSRTVAKESAQGKTDGLSLFGALFLSLAITLPITLLTLCLAGSIPALSNESGVLKILVFSLPFACGYAVIKGYFFGRKRFAATAFIEFLEEIVMTVCGVVLLLIFKGATPLRGAQYAALAMSISCVFAATVSAITLAKDKLRPRFSSTVLPPLLKGSLPITAMRLSATAIQAVSAVLLPAALQKVGYTSSQALAAFGVATGMVLPLLCAPMTVVGALSTVLLPELAEAHAKNQKRRLLAAMEKGLYFTLVLSTGFLPLFYALAKPLCNLLYQTPLAGELMQSGCILLPAMSLAALAQSYLNSLGYEKNSFIFSLIGAAVFLLLLIILPKFFGIYAYTIALITQFFIVGIISLVFLFKLQPPSKGFFRRSALPLILLLPLFPFATTAVKFCARFFSEPFATLLAALFILAISALLFFLCGVFRKKS